MRAGLASEDELCLLLARGQLSSEVRQRALELLATPLRWDLLLQRASEHQVSPLLYRSLRTLEFPHVPVEVQAALTMAFQKNALRNAFLSRKLAGVLCELSGAGVPVIPLKGVTLAESLFGDAALRICYDLDILVPAGEVIRARRLLLAQGYTSPFSEDFFRHHQLRTSADCPLLPEKEEPSCPYLLEIHWTLLHHSSQDEKAMQELWSEARPKSFFGIPAFTLTTEWEFLFLAEHAAYHKWDTLKWLADIHELCVSASIDWPQVKAKAERLGLDLAVGPTLTACSALFGTPIPACMSSPPLPAGVHLFPHSLDPAEAWKAPLFYPKLLKRPSEKLRWFAEMFFVARLADRRLFRLPAALSFLYYLLRPLRLTCKWTWLGAQAAYRRLRQTRPSRPSL